MGEIAHVEDAFHVFLHGPLCPVISLAIIVS